AIKKQSTVNVYDNPATDIQEGKVLVVGNCDDEKINASSICCVNICNTTSTCGCDPDSENLFKECEEDGCPPNEDKFDMPPIDWLSYYNKAKQAEFYGLCSVSGKKFYQEVATTLSNKCIFTGQQFEDLWDKVGLGGTLILEHKTNEFAISTYYVEGGITVDWERHLKINGVLVVDKSVYIGNWCNGYLVINDPGPGIPSGLLTQGKMKFGGWFFFWGQDVDVEGLLYSNEEFTINGNPHIFTVVGGIIGRKFHFTYGWNNPLNIYLDNNIIKEGVWGGPQPPVGELLEYSPVVTVEHWEESY
ncbi:unnamed protein product, partial [marine sediment metagenome]